MILEDNEIFRCLPKGDKARVNNLILYSPKGHWVKCIKCDEHFILDSTLYRVHLLFTHGFYADTCKSNDSKKRETNILKGMEVRQSRLLEKRMIHLQRRNGKLQLWSCRLRQFLTNMETTILLPTPKHRQDPEYTRKYNSVIQ